MTRSQVLLGNFVFAIEDDLDLQRRWVNKLPSFSSLRVGEGENETYPLLVLSYFVALDLETWEAVKSSTKKRHTARGREGILENCAILGCDLGG
jgi:hypothetical protein